MLYLLSLSINIQLLDTYYLVFHLIPQSFKSYYNQMMEKATQSKMLLVEKKVLKFKKRYQKILYMAPTLNNTICFLGIVGHRMDCLTHIDHQGNIKNQIIFEDSMDSFAALSQKQIMVLQTRKNNILIWDLQKNQKINIPFSFKTYQTDQSQIFIFPETQLVCIQENGRYNNNTFKLTYFKYPIEEGQQALCEYESDQVWNYQYLIRKGNNHSMVCWFKGRHDDGFEFRTFDLRQEFLTQEHLKNAKLEHKVYKFQNDLGKNFPGSPKAEVSLSTMWQMTPYKFMLVCITSLSNIEQNINNNYVYNAKDGTLRQSLFNFDQHNFGSTCMFRTFDFDNGQPLETPVFYINNESEEIIAQETWKCSYLHKYNFLGWESNSIIELMFENGDVDEVSIMIKKIMQPREIHVHFLLECYRYWHEDLIRHVIELIGSPKSQFKFY